jgi:hypothetical protein
MLYQSSHNNVVLRVNSIKKLRLMSSWEKKSVVLYPRGFTATVVHD